MEEEADQLSFLHVESGSEHEHEQTEEDQPSFMQVQETPSKEKYTMSNVHHPEENMSPEDDKNPKMEMMESGPDQASLVHFQAGREDHTPSKESMLLDDNKMLAALLLEKERDVESLREVVHEMEQELSVAAAESRNFESDVKSSAKKLNRLKSILERTEYNKSSNAMRMALMATYSSDSEASTVLSRVSSRLEHDFGKSFRSSDEYSFLENPMRVLSPLSIQATPRADKDKVPVDPQDYSMQVHRVEELSREVAQLKEELATEKIKWNWKLHSSEKRCKQENADLMQEMSKQLLERDAEIVAWNTELDTLSKEVEGYVPPEEHLRIKDEMEALILVLTERDAQIVGYEEEIDTLAKIIETSVSAEEHAHALEARTAEQEEHAQALEARTAEQVYSLTQELKMRNAEVATCNEKILTLSRDLQDCVPVPAGENAEDCVEMKNEALKNSSQELSPSQNEQEEESISLFMHQLVVKENQNLLKITSELESMIEQNRVKTTKLNKDVSDLSTHKKKAVSEQVKETRISSQKNMELINKVAQLEKRNTKLSRDVEELTLFKKENSKEKINEKQHAKLMTEVKFLKQTVGTLEAELLQSDQQINELSKELQDMTDFNRSKEEELAAAQNSLSLLRVKVLSTAGDQEELLDIVESRSAEVAALRSSLAEKEEELEKLHIAAIATAEVQRHVRMLKQDLEMSENKVAELRERVMEGEETVAGSERLIAKFTAQAAHQEQVIDQLREECTLLDRDLHRRKKDLESIRRQEVAKAKERENMAKSRGRSPVGRPKDRAKQQADLEFDKKHRLYLDEMGPGEVSMSATLTPSKFPNFMSTPSKSLYSSMVQQTPTRHSGTGAGGGGGRGGGGGLYSSQYGEHHLDHSLSSIANGLYSTAMDQHLSASALNSMQVHCFSIATQTEIANTWGYLDPDAVAAANETAEAAANTVDELSRSLVAMNEKVGYDQFEIEKLKNDVYDAQEVLSEAESEIKRLNEVLESTSSNDTYEIQELKASLRVAENDVVDLKVELRVTEGETLAAKNESQKLRENLANMESEKDLVEAQMRKVKDVYKIETHSTEGAIAKLTKDLKGAKEEVEKKEKELDSAHAELEYHSQKRYSKHVSETEAMQQLVDELTEGLSNAEYIEKALRKEIDNSNLIVKSLKLELQDQKLELEDCQNQIAAFGTSKSQLMQQLTAVEGEISSKRRDVENYEGETVDLKRKIELCRNKMMEWEQERVEEQDQLQAQVVEARRQVKEVGVENDRKGELLKELEGRICQLDSELYEMRDSGSIQTKQLVQDLSRSNERVREISKAMVELAERCNRDIQEMNESFESKDAELVILRAEKARIDVEHRRFKEECAAKDDKVSGLTTALEQCREELKGAQNTDKRSHSELVEALTNATVELNRSKAEIEDLRQEAISSKTLGIQAKECELLRQQLSSMKSVVTTKEREISVLTIKKEHLNKQRLEELASLQDEIERANGAFLTLTEESEVVVEVRNKLETELDKVSNTLQREREAHNQMIQKLSESVSRNSSDLQEILKENHSLRTQMRDTRADDRNNGEMQHLQQLLAAKSIELVQLSDAHAALSKEVNSMSASQSTLQVRWDKKVEEERAKEDMIAKELTTLRDRNNALSTEVISLRAKASQAYENIAFMSQKSSNINIQNTDTAKISREVERLTRANEALRADLLSMCYQARRHVYEMQLLCTGEEQHASKEQQLRDYLALIKLVDEYSKVVERWNHSLFTKN